MSDRLFDTADDPGRRARTAVPAAEAPLAVRMRPRSLDELVGQEHLLGQGSTLRTAIETGEPHSMILYGPPGAGKTTLARIVAGAARGAFEEESAVNAGRAEVRAVIARAEERRRATGQPTIFFLDEIHRFNKAQQDALLPAVEEGLVTLIGATTENPYFEVNSALLSRSQIYELRGLERGAGARAARAGAGRPGARDRRPAGDRRRGARAARRAGRRRRAHRARGARAGGRDRARRRRPRSTSARPRTRCSARRSPTTSEGDRHYDYVSAWIKATRGSDPDASLYYLAVMLEGGEDPRFIARRMVILASEDIGNADPQALVVATAAAHAVDRVGLPECALNLAQAAAYLALAPKSNASTIGDLAGEARRSASTARSRRPTTCATPTTRARRQLGRGQGYGYPHDEPGGVADQPLLPPEVAGRALLRADRPRARGRARGAPRRRQAASRPMKVSGRHR